MKNNYFDYSRDITVGVLFIFPFLVMYEVLFFFHFQFQDIYIRNTADFVIRNSFNFLGFFSQFIIPFFLFFLGLFIYFFKIKKNKKFKIIRSYMFLMIFEGLLYGLLLSLIFNDINYFQFNTNIHQSNFLLNTYLSIGAGIWEETLFRLLLLNFFIFVLFKIFSDSSYFNILLAMFFSSIIFSLFHYIGADAEQFNWYIFYIRFLAGILLSLIYYYRGYGVVSVTHIIYDFILVALPLI